MYQGTCVGLLLCLCHCILGEQPPVIYTNPLRRITYFSDGSARQLRCAATGYPTPRYKWFKNNMYFNATQAVHMENGTILISRMRKKDEGVYQCSATNKLGTAQSDTTKLIMLRMKKIPKRNLKEVVRLSLIGTTVYLRCMLPESVPPARMILRINNTIIDENIATNFVFIPGGIFIKAVQSSDKPRIFQCSAFNAEWNTERPTRNYLLVAEQGPLMQSRPTLRYRTPSRVVFLRGKSGVITAVFSGSALLNYVWRRISDNASSGIETGVLPTTTTTSPSQNISGDSGGVRVLPSRCSLEFRGVTVGMAGRYAVTVSNALGTHRIVFHVTVESAPQWRVGAAGGPPASVTARAGARRAAFRCRAEGRPAPWVAWQINGVLLARVAATDRWRGRVWVTGDRLNFANLMFSDSSVIQCNASNPYGYVFANAYLHVLQPTRLGSEFTTNIISKW